MTKTYITFGQSHLHRINGVTSDCDCVAEVNLPEEQAREFFMPKFCFSYTEEQFKAKEEDMMDFYPRGIISVKQFAEPEEKVCPDGVETLQQVLIDIGQDSEIDWELELEKQSHAITEK
jgi:hypothetical protein